VISLPDFKTKSEGHPSPLYTKETPNHAKQNCSYTPTSDLEAKVAGPSETSAQKIMTNDMICGSENNKTDQKEKA